MYDRAKFELGDKVIYGNCKYEIFGIRHTEYGYAYKIKRDDMNPCAGEYFEILEEFLEKSED